MELFDKKGNKIHINTDKFIQIGSGCFGKVYRTESGAFKTINSGCIYPVDPKVLEYLRDAKLKGFYKIKDIYYDKNDEVKAYTMKFYDQIKINLLENKDYLIESIYNIYHSILELSSQHIKCLDLMDRNVIKTPKGLKVIDCDFYAKTKFNAELSNLMILLDTLMEMLGADIDDLLNRDLSLYRIYHDCSHTDLMKHIFIDTDLKKCIENLLIELDKCNKPYEYLLRK